jgi:phage-related protein
MNTFTFRPTTCSQRKTPRVIVSTFGDGYEQRQEDGLNANLPTYDLTFVDVPQAEGDAIDAFLDANGPVSGFFWTPPFPGATQGIYKCTEWSRDLSSEIEGNSNITATFKRVVA